MDISKLKKIDIKEIIKNIDVDKIKKSIQEFNLADLKKAHNKNPEILIKGIIIAVTVLFFFISIIIYFNHLGSYSKQKKKYIKRAKKISTLKKTEDEWDTYFSKLPQRINPEILSSTLSDYAKNRNIKILSISPNSESETELYLQKQFELKIKAIDYKNIAMFVHDIEKSPFALRLESWAGDTIAKKNKRKIKSKNKNLDVDPELFITITLSALEFKG